MAILFHDYSFKSGIKDKRKIKAWIDAVVEKENLKAGNINIVFTNDEDLREINIKYLSHNYYTDIITFDYSEGNSVSGDIYISVERVQENAEKFHVEKRMEMLRVIIHGILHLTGYNDSDESEKKKMRYMEDESLKYYSSVK